MEEMTLPHVHFHDECPETILLLHGAFASHNEFQGATPFLKRWHVLAPDHTGDIAGADFSVDGLVDGLARFVHKHAKESRAHVVGFSFGGHLALRLSSRHPHLVSTLLVSGVNRISPSYRSSLIAASVLVSQYVGVIQKFSSKLFAGESNAKTGESNAKKGETSIPTLAHIKNVLAVLESDQRCAAIYVRVLVVAATRSGLLLNDDDPRTARDVFQELKGVAGSRVVAHRGVTHSWVQQNPEFFGRTVAAWVGGQAIDDQFRAIADPQ